MKTSPFPSCCPPAALKPMASLEIRKIRKSFETEQGRMTVLDGLSFRVRDGEFVSVLGPSGCGKSTLLNILSGLLPYDEGEIYWEGQRVPHLRSRAAYMIQKDLLLPWRRVLENVLLFPEILGIPRSESEPKARTLLMEVGLQGFERHYPHQLSGGMRQRVALARTLIANKDILLLDEPFGALDAITRANLQDLLLHLWHRYRPTILFVTHDIEEALLLSDRILVLSAVPARILEDLAVSLPRPREVTDPAFIQLKAHLLRLLRKSHPHPERGT